MLHTKIQLLSMQRNYNFIYSKIVENEYDIVGHIAYSLYKKDKIAHIERFKHKHSKEPLDQELIPFNDFSSSDSSIESYRMKAEMIMQGFISNVLDETVQDIENNTKKNQAAILQEIINPILPPKKWKQFWNGTLENIVAAFIISLLVALFVVGMQMRNAGAKEVIESTFNVKIVPQTVEKTDSIRNIQ